MIEDVLQTAMNGEVGRAVGLAGHAHLSMYVTNQGDRPGLLVDIEMPKSAHIDDGQGFDVLRLDSGARGRVLVRPTTAGKASPAFIGLVEFVFRKTQGASSREDAVNKFVDAIHEFKAFFARRRERLNESQIRGLFSELEFLLELLEAGLNAEEALYAWTGPYRGADFRFVNGTVVEVKSSHPSAHGVRVSSEYQLEIPQEGMFLFVRPLTRVTSEDASGRSLLELLADIESYLVGAPWSHAQWSSALDALGFDISDYYYERWRFISSGWEAYPVTEVFPRIIPAITPEGVSDVSYTVQFEAIRHLQDDPQSIFEELKVAYNA